MNLDIVSVGIAIPFYSLLWAFLLQGVGFSGEKENVSRCGGVASDPNFPTHSSLGHEWYHCFHPQTSFSFTFIFTFTFLQIPQIETHTKRHLSLSLSLSFSLHYGLSVSVSASASALPLPLSHSLILNWQFPPSVSIANFSISFAFFRIQLAFSSLSYSRDLSLLWFSSPSRSSVRLHCFPHSLRY